MDYRKFGECYYIRMDRDDEIISTILEICKKENIRSATFSGIGGCKDAEIQTFIPETGSFEEQRISGMLELVSLNGNVVTEIGRASCRERVCNFNIFHSSCTGCIRLFLYADTIHGFPVMDRLFSILSSVFAPKLFK